MTKSQALQKWIAIRGEGAAVRDGGSRLASTPARRAEARDKMKVLRKLSYDEKKKHRKEIDHWTGEMFRYRYSIGHWVIGGLAFGVDGSGDTWKDCFEDYESRRIMFSKTCKDMDRAMKQAVA